MTPSSALVLVLFLFFLFLFLLYLGILLLTPLFLLFFLPPSPPPRLSKLYSLQFLLQRYIIIALFFHHLYHLFLPSFLPPYSLYHSFYLPFLARIWPGTHVTRLSFYKIQSFTKVSEPIHSEFDFTRRIHSVSSIADFIQLSINSLVDRPD